MASDFLSSIAVEHEDEALPKRIADREAIPNPFIQDVHDSYAESLDPSIGPDKAVRRIWVPVKDADCTVRTQTVKRKDKSGKVTESKVQWQAHPDVTTAMYLLRRAAAKNDLGVRIVPDYDDDHNFVVQPSGAHKGKVRVRFLGIKKKDTKKSKGTTEATA